MKKIIQDGDPVLRDTAKEVSTESIKSPEIKKLLQDMSKALATQKDGVAIAAPQIGVSLRVFIVSGRLFDTGEDLDTSTHPDLVFINPTITKVSKNSSSEEEGCLSVTGKYGEVDRASKTTVRAYNEEGEVFERGGSGLLSKIFQHEMDHLNGVLFIDKAKEVHDKEI
ncbi:peptide deformylase [bacterium]|jgi:peptide deformylase|nr:peptide deformylase [bacterium]MBT4894832.1 peptide deformylase [bacterium]